jgi:C4-dicarboxylate transporter DctM subunit
VEPAVTTGIAGLLLGMTTAFGYVLTTLQVPLKLANAIMAVSDSRWVFLVLVNRLLSVASCLLNATAMLIVSGAGSCGDRGGADVLCRVRGAVNGVESRRR